MLRCMIALGAFGGSQLGDLENVSFDLCVSMYPKHRVGLGILYIHIHTVLKEHVLRGLTHLISLDICR